MIEVVTERKECPREFASQLAALGGTNIYGEPRFILFWGQTRTIPTGFGSMLHGQGVPAWFLAEWKPAEEWGTPETWDYDLLGPYPHRGQYDIIQPFYRSLGKGKVEPMQLNRRTFDFIIPVVLRHAKDSFEKRMQTIIAQKAAEDRALEGRIADCLQDAYPSFTDATSFAGQTNKHTVVQQKIEQLERGGAPLRPGLQQIPA